MLTVILRSSSSLWLFLRVVPRVLRPVICRDNLNILRILKILNICAALAIYSSEYCEDSWLRIRETKNGRIPRRSIILRKERINSNLKGRNIVSLTLSYSLKRISTFDGETTNLMRNSRVNQPTNIASVDRKK